MAVGCFFIRVRCWYILSITAITQVQRYMQSYSSDRYELRRMYMHQMHCRESGQGQRLYSNLGRTVSRCGGGPPRPVETPGRTDVKSNSRLLFPQARSEPGRLKCPSWLHASQMSVTKRVLLWDTACDTTTITSLSFFSLSCISRSCLISLLLSIYTKRINHTPCSARSLSRVRASSPQRAPPRPLGVPPRV